MVRACVRACVRANAACVFVDGVCRAAVLLLTACACFGYTALHCTALHCTALHCAALHRTALRLCTCAWVFVLVCLDLLLRACAPVCLCCRSFDIHGVREETRLPLTGRYSAAVGVFNLNTLVVVGGLDANNQPVQRIDAFDFTARTWSQLSFPKPPPGMLNSATGFHGVMAGARLYFGWSDDGTSAQIGLFSLNTVNVKRHVSCTPAFAREGATLGVMPLAVGFQIVAIGGRTPGGAVAEESVVFWEDTPCHTDNKRCGCKDSGSCTFSGLTYQCSCGGCGFQPGPDSQSYCAGDDPPRNLGECTGSGEEDSDDSSSGDDLVLILAVVGAVVLVALVVAVYAMFVLRAKYAGRQVSGGHGEPGGGQRGDRDGDRDPRKGLGAKPQYSDNHDNHATMHGGAGGPQLSGVRVDTRAPPGGNMKFAATYYGSDSTMATGARGTPQHIQQQQFSHHHPQQHFQQQQQGQYYPTTASQQGAPPQHQGSSVQGTYSTVSRNSRVSHGNSPMHSLTGKQGNARQQQQEFLAGQSWAISADQISLLERVGAGAYGMVWKGTYAGSLVALKQLFSNMQDAQNLAEVGGVGGWVAWVGGWRGCAGDVVFVVVVCFVLFCFPVVVVVVVVVVVSL